MDSRTRLPGFKSHLCYLLACSPHPLSSSVGKTRLTTVPASNECDNNYRAKHKGSTENSALHMAGAPWTVTVISNSISTDNAAVSHNPAEMDTGTRSQEKKQRR